MQEGQAREGRREVEVGGRGKEIKLKRTKEKERWIEGEKRDKSFMGDLVERVVGRGIL